MKEEKLPLTKNGALKVELIPMPASDNPWRTKADYLAEQKRDTIRYRITIASLIISIISVVVTALIAINTIQEMAH